MEMACACLWFICYCLFLVHVLGLEKCYVKASGGGCYVVLLHHVVMSCFRCPLYPWLQQDRFSDCRLLGGEAVMEVGFYSFFLVGKLSWR